MSLSALLLATRNYIRTTVPLSAVECNIEPDGQPIPSFGKRYIAVHATEWSPPERILTGLVEEFSLSITVTYRANAFPRDAIGNELYIKALTGMEDLCRDIMLAVHDNYTLMNDANTLITSGDNKFVHPLLWIGTDPTPQPKDGTWVWADNPEVINNLAAYSMEIRFGKAQRFQTRTNMT